MTKDSGELLTPKQLAEYLGVPVKTLYSWRYLGSGPRAVHAGRYLRFRRGDVETWLEARADRPQATG